MRDDFAKQLTERERHRHSDKFHNYRNVRGPSGLNDDYFGGRESMRVRYNFGYDRKSFNENLNPLKGWLHSCLGKKWDKCYSELRKKFDARKVVNNHILEHLFDFVEVNTKLVDGVVMVLDGYNGSRGYVPLKKRQYNMRWPEYYVCPKDGTLKSMHKPSRRSIVKQAEAEKLRAQLAVKRVLNEREVLHLIDGVWYHFTLEEIPKVKVVYEKPYGVNTFAIGHHLLGRGQIVKTWDELNQAERERFGTKRLIGGRGLDKFTNETVYRDERGIVHRSAAGWAKPSSNTLYHATKQTASKKHLKEAGILGTAAANDDSIMSHREASKYRKAA